MRKKGFNLTLMSNFMLLFGFFATMPLIQVLSVTAYIVFLMMFAIAILVILFTNKIRINYHNIEKEYIIIFALSTISILYNAISMPLEWRSGNVSAIIQLFIVLLYYLFFVLTKNELWLNSYVKGVYYASVFQMCWGYFQLIFDSFGIDLNTKIFNEFLRMNVDSVTQTYDNSIKVSGLCWNSGNIAPLYLFGYVYSNHIVLKLMFVILALVSGSRTALLGITFCLLLQIIFGLKGKRSYKKNQIYIVLGIMLVGFVIYIVNRKVADAQIERIANIINTLERVASESSGGIHLRYITSVPEVTRMNGILHNLIGYGASCSGYVFSHFYNQYTTIGIWAVECDYVNYLWNFGYLGFAVYYFWYGKNALKCCRMDNRYYLLFLGLLFEGFFYNVTFNWVNLLIVSIFILGQKNINIFQPNNYLENAYVKENK